MMKKVYKTKTERKDTKPNVIQSTENTETVWNERPTQSTAYKALHKTEFCRQAQNQDNIIMTRSGWISRKTDRPCYY